MLRYPNIDPVAIHLGPLKVQWYGISYIVGIIAGWWLLRRRSRDPHLGWTPEQLADLTFYVALGAVLGGRLGYVLFYNLPVYVHDPVSIFKVWQGGMSFHGGLLGTLAAVWLYGRKYARPFFRVLDFVAPVVPIGLGAGRIGNFINGELWGAPTNLPWAMVFPDPRAGALPRHPTQLYEALLEGLVLFIILWVFSAKPRPTMAISGLFLVLYGCFRSAVEFVRVPDAHLGYLAFNWVTMGQVLSLPMILLGGFMMILAYRERGWVGT
ncbi:MAG: prolipoprotein diacylglyceryl transferase [Gammaproteobacteria bacterium]|nr:prolipoprotein diacylglyceryl transferase [Gammaproteobacteria bacterium]